MLELSKAGRRYGYLRDSIDHRDFGLSNFQALHSGRGISSVDLEPFCGPVLDQGQEGACAGHFGAEVRAFLARKYENHPIDFSPAFIYYLARQMDAFLAANMFAPDTHNRWPTNAELLAFIAANPKVDDTGTYGRTVCRVLNQFGACTRASMPYVAGDFSTPPTDAQLSEGLAYKGGAYHRINTVADMKSCLASGYTFGIGFTVYESFESEQVANDGLWKPDKNTERVLGGHEVQAIGCDDSINGGSFKVRTSWSSSWGVNGNFYLRYSDAADPGILQDGWMTHLGRSW
jgi:hypothetical protein